MEYQMRFGYATGGTSDVTVCRDNSRKMRKNSPPRNAEDETPRRSPSWAHVGCLYGVFFYVTVRVVQQPRARLSPSLSLSLFRCQNALTISYDGTGRE